MKKTVARVVWWGIRMIALLFPFSIGLVIASLGGWAWHKAVLFGCCFEVVVVLWFAFLFGLAKAHDWAERNR